MRNSWGRNAARIADFVATEQIVALLGSEAQRDGSIIAMIKTASYAENASCVARLLDALRRGFLEAKRS